jgi:hypothetical protein
MGGIHDDQIAFTEGSEPWAQEGTCKLHGTRIAHRHGTDPWAQDSQIPGPGGADGSAVL